MISRNDLTAVILAGGAAQKAGIGTPTCMLEVEGRKVIERQALLLKPKVSRIEVSVSGPAPWSRFPTQVDEFDPIGPLAGIASTLKYASTDYVLFISAAYAWIKPEVLDLLVARAGDPFDGCAVRLGYSTPKPLFSILHKRAGPRAIARIERGEHDVTGLFTSESLAVRWIEDYELESFDPQMTTFKVVDNPDAVIATPSAPPARVVEGSVAFPFQSLDAYQSAIAFLPIAHALAKLDPEIGGPLMRAALAINVAIADGGATGRSSVYACAATLDALRAIGIADPRIAEGQALLAKIAAQLG